MVFIAYMGTNIKKSRGFYLLLQYFFALLICSKLFTITIVMRKFISEKACEVNLLFFLSISIAGNRIAVLSANILGTVGESPKSGFSSLIQSYFIP